MTDITESGRAYFALSGYHFNPDDITRALGITPTSTDDRGAGSGMDKPKMSSWEWSTETVNDDIDVYDLTDIILKKLEPVKKEILQLIESHNLAPRVGIVLELAVEEQHCNPDIGFGSRTLRFLAELGAFINIEYKLAKAD